MGFHRRFRLCLGRRKTKNHWARPQNLACGLCAQALLSLLVIAPAAAQPTVRPVASPLTMTNTVRPTRSQLLLDAVNAPARPISMQAPPVAGVPLPQEEAPLPAVLPPNEPALAEFALHDGIRAFERGEFQAAIGHLSRVGDDQLVANYYRALSYLGVKDYAQALKLLQTIQHDPSAPIETGLEVGAAQLALGDNPGARDTFRAYTESHPDDSLGHFLLGAALLGLQDREAAIVEFDRARSDSTLAQYIDAALDPQGPSAQLARAMAPAMTAPPPPPPRRWNLVFLNGYDYDSNVGLFPSFTGLGAVTNKADSSWFVASFGDYRVVQRENINIGLIGSTYDRFQFNQTGFNFQDYMGGGYSNVAVGRYNIASIRYEFHEQLLGGNQFATEHRLVPNWTFREGTFGHTTVYYEYDHNTFQLPVLIPAFVRTGTVHSVGTTQAIYTFGGKGRLFAGYRFADYLAEGSDFCFTSNMVTGRIEQPLSKQLIADGEVRQFWDNYKNPNSLDFQGRPRLDQILEVRAGLQYYFKSKLSLRFDYLYVNSNSNVANLFGVNFFEYSRHVFRTQLIYDF